MPTNSQTDRDDAGSLIPEDVAREIIQSAPEQSAVLSLARRLPNMTRAQQRMPILSVLPQAYFVTGDTGLKQTTRMAWANRFINAEEIAVIIPIPEAVIDDVDYDIWAEARPRLIEAIGGVIDRAILFGDDAPDSWPDDILAGATAAGHTVAEGTGVDLYDDILGESGIISLIEADGYMANGHVAQMGMRAKLRGLRDADGRPLFMTDMQNAGQYMLDGERIIFPRNGSFLPGDPVSMITGDWTQLVYSIRQDLTWKLLDQAVLTDNAGNIIYNLAQQDMVAMRVVMRMGWQLPNPMNRLNQNEATRYPFAVLTP